VVPTLSFGPPGPGAWGLGEGMSSSPIPTKGPGRGGTPCPPHQGSGGGSWAPFPIPPRAGGGDSCPFSCPTPGARGELGRGLGPLPPPYQGPGGGCLGVEVLSLTQLGAGGVDRNDLVTDEKERLGRISERMSWSKSDLTRYHENSLSI